ncbi:sodium:solute symporter family protein [Speluncibacter jeojiensis]|uniref:Sodium:solute symporter family protein n=1 Tax=Speluncibacter jeojiensis TaxID=2710754 RepID=A0A9X4M0Z6_9ACTN|nr:sodium:solute symporter family protein [Corynebacteriales bacterium D3-21]
MSGSAAVATGIFAAAMVLVLVVGTLSARGRAGGLTEWSLSGRRLGIVFVWLLMAGESYTSFSFLGTAGWSYAYGVPILYLVAYLTVGLTIAYVVAPMMWTYASRHQLVSMADIAEHRFSSRRMGVLVALVATVFLVPYIQLQIQGMGAVVGAMTYGAVDAKVAAVIAFLVAEGFILVSGLRGSAWVSALKDVLVIAVVLFLAIYLPWHYFDGIGGLLDRMVAERPQWLTFPGHHSGSPGGAWFVSTVLLNGLTLSVFPNNVSAYLSAKDPNTLRRNSILLPWYQLLLFIPMMIGVAALFVVPALRDSDLALYTLVTDSLPAPVVALIGVAGALSAIVPMSVFMLALGTMWGRTVLGGGLTGRRASDARQKRLAQLVCFLVGLVALVGALFVPVLLVRLSVLSYEGFAQLVPPVLLALLWKSMTVRGAVCGLAAGLAVTVSLVWSGNDPLFGVNAGLIALGVNVAVNATVSRFDARGPRRPRVSAATPSAMPPTAPRP